MNELFDTLLLIEDEPAHAMIIKRALEPLAKSCATVQTLQDAYNWLDSNKADLIITDLNLPDSKGVSNLPNLMEKGGGVPLVVLTASSSISDAVQAMHLGAEDFILKEFDDNFNELMRLALSRIHSAQQAEREKKRLQRDMESLRVAIENGQDGMAVVDENGNFSYMNSSFREFIKECGGSPDNLFVIFSNIVKGHDVLISTLKDKLKTLGKSASWNTEITFQNKPKDSDIAFSLNISIIQEEQNERLAVIWVRDVTEAKKKERFQKEMLSTTTHDLKGPLGSISLCTYMLKDYLEPGSKPFEVASRIESSTQSAIQMIDEFLEARRLQEGHYILKPKKQNVYTLVEDVIKENAPYAESKGVALSFTVPATDSHSGNSHDVIEWTVDAAAIKRVVANLISNAIKFTGQSGKVTVSLYEEAEHLHIVVEDTGVGMEPSELQKIFDRFSRASEHRGIKGTGLGLYVVKNIVTAHGGHISVTSEPGKGSRFDLAFPKEPPVDKNGEIICLGFA